MDRFWWLYCFSLLCTTAIPTATHTANAAKTANATTTTTATTTTRTTTTTASTITTTTTATTTTMTTTAAAANTILARLPPHHRDWNYSSKGPGTKSYGMDKARHRTARRQQSCAEKPNGPSALKEKEKHHLHSRC